MQSFSNKKNMIQEYYSNGKFLISGEYLVINGALSLALPLKYGQSLRVIESDSGSINWQTMVDNKLWFKAKFNKSFKLIESSNNEIASFLVKLFSAAKSLNPEFSKNIGCDVLSEINFDINWGLGSSSTLISNMAYWAKVNPFDLFKLIANGSGYDIACARENTPIRYKLIDNIPDYESVEFNPEFRNKLFFAYLGKKQNSEKSIKLFKQKSIFSSNEIDKVSELTNSFINADNIELFSDLIQDHEELISSILNKTPIKKEFFNDFEGQIKSLGAWGGDFVMIASKLPFENIKSYFLNKGIDVIYKYDEIVLNK